MMVKTATSTDSVSVPIAFGDTQQMMLDDALVELTDYYGVSYGKMNAVIQCESGWNPKAINLKDPEGGSKGILQFQQSTFDYFAKDLGLKDPDIWNPYQQIEVATLMWSRELESRWSCYKKLSQAHAL